MAAKRHRPQPKDIDLYQYDAEFNDDILGRIATHIKRGASGKGAAALAGVKRGRFEFWYKSNSTFRDYIDTLVEKYNSILRELILKDTKQIKDPKKRADARLRLLERRDKEFGARVEQVIFDENAQTLLPEQDKEVDDLIEKHAVVDEAERIANE